MNGDEVFEKHDLPSGAWVAFRDPKLVTRRQRKTIDRVQTRLALAVDLHHALKGEAAVGTVADSDIDLLEQLMEAVIVTLIEEWSLDAAVDVDALQDLRDDDYKALIGYAAVHRSVLLPDFEPGPKEDEDGNERPTGPSPESSIISEAIGSTVSSQPTSSEPGIS